MTIETERLTYEDYLNGPEIKQRYDIVDGMMIMASSPNLARQRILRRLSLELDRFVTHRELGEILFAPLDVIIRREPLRARQPDLMFVSHERSSILDQVVEGAPDMVAEILSPGNTRAELADKLEDYAAIGVRECWLVSPEAGTVETLTLTEGNWERAALRGVGDSVHTDVLRGLELGVSSIFP